MNLDALKELKQKALEEHIPILMDDTLEKIEEIIKEKNPKRILEIGTAVGYSASCFAKASTEDCIIDTIELDNLNRYFLQTKIILTNKCIFIT